MDLEHKVLDHYQLTTPYPTSWPAEKDESNSSEEELSNTILSKPSLHGSKSRYSALEKHGTTRRSLVPGSEKTGDGVENLVQKDEADPLGGPDSVVRVLRRHGIPVEDDQRFREVIRDSCLAYVDFFQGIDFFSPLLLFHRRCTYHKFNLMLPRKLYCKGWNSSPAPLTRNLLLSKFSWNRTLNASFARKRQ